MFPNAPHGVLDVAEGLSDHRTVVCATCGRDNPARLTFCEDCGARLAARVSAPTPPVGVRVDTNGAFRPPAPDLSFNKSEPPKEGAGSSRPSAPRPSAPDLLAQAEIAPMAIQIAAPPELPLGAERGRACPRCRGLCDTAAAFCRFCGATLAEPDRASAAETNLVPALVRARVVSIGPDGAANATFELTERLDIGRSEGDVIITWDPYLSPRHLRLEAGPGVLVARDLGSVNGTFVRVRGPALENGAVATGLEAHDAASAFNTSAFNKGVPLEDQDLILLGQQVIRFEVVKDAEAGFGPATQHGTALFGTPAGPVYARLCQRTVEGVTRDVFHVRKDEVALGRELGDFVFTDDAFLSRRHALVRRDAKTGTFSLHDAGSSNGTFLRARGEMPIAPGDEIRIGQQLFRIEPGPAQGEPVAASGPAATRRVS